MEFALNNSEEELIHYSSEDILNVEVKIEGMNDDQFMQEAYVKQESELAIGQIISLKDNVRLLHIYGYPAV